MSIVKNYVQYIDDTYTVKVKPVLLVDGSYIVDGINTEFFILSLFLNDKRVDSVDIINHANLMCKSVINDLTIVDLNVISKNHFFAAFAVVELNYTPVASGGSSGGGSSGANCCNYGVVCPTFVYSNDFITSKSKYLRIYRELGDDMDSITIERGVFDVSTKAALRLPFYGGLDITSAMDFVTSVNAYFSLDDIYLNLQDTGGQDVVDFMLIVNPESNTFSFIPTSVTSPLVSISYTGFDTLTSMTIEVKSSDDALFVQYYNVRWKNTPLSFGG